MQETSREAMTGQPAPRRKFLLIPHQCNVLLISQNMKAYIPQKSNIHIIEQSVFLTYRFLYSNIYNILQGLQSLSHAFIANTCFQAINPRLCTFLLLTLQPRTLPLVTALEHLETLGCKQQLALHACTTFDYFSLHSSSQTKSFNL